MSNKNSPESKLPFFIFIALAFGLLLYSFSNWLPNFALGQTPLFEHTLSGTYDPVNTNGEYYGGPVTSKEVQFLASENKTQLADTSVLGTSTAAKRIEIDLSQQRLYAFEGDRKVYDFLISSGKWGRTPTGTFSIWIKLRYTRMTGGKKELNTYYDLPNVPYTMFFANAEIPTWRGFGIHGTYWHNNFGHPMSHGCINMKTEEVAQLYYWADPVLPEGKQSIRVTADNPGTPVIIYGTAPKS